MIQGVHADGTIATLSCEAVPAHSILVGHSYGGAADQKGYAKAVTVDAAKFKAIPKVYLFTEKDPILSLASQHAFAERAQISDSDTLETGHYRMLADGQALADLIVKWGVDKRGS